MSDSKARLSQKLREYREMAAVSRKAAETAATPGMKRSHEELSRSWEQLILEVESLLRGGL